MVREILVVKRSALFPDGAFHGFVSKDEKDYMAQILGAYEYQERDSVEGKPEWQQPIPYIWLIHKADKKVFVYRRAEGDGYKEERLKSKWSCGIGGHIDKITDELDSGADGNPIIAAMLREMEEEVSMEVYPRPEIIGFLNDDRDSIGQDHFGIIAVAEVEGEVKPGDEEMAEGRWMSISEAEEHFDRDDVEIEGWTELSWPLVKKYLN